MNSEPKTYICSNMFNNIIFDLGKNKLKSCNKTPYFNLTNSELRRNNFLNNSDFIKRKRSMLFNNNLPENICKKCINYNDSFFNLRNDYYNKEFNKIEKIKLMNNKYITNIEIILNDICNLKCIYCNHNFSSEWYKELITETTNDKTEILKSHDIHNPISQSIYPFLISFIHTLDNEKNYTFTFTGGEPLLQKRLYEILDVISNKFDNVIINIFTNLSVKKKVVNNLIIFQEKHKNLKFKLFCSIDGLNKQAEAIRTGLSWNLFISNLELLLKSDIELKIAPALNLYSVFKLKLYINWSSI